MRIDHLEQVIDLILIRLNHRRVALKVHIRGTNQRERAFVGQHKDNALILVLQNVSLTAMMQLWHHDVTTLDQTHAVR